MTDSDTRATGGPGALPPEAFVPATPAAVPTGAAAVRAAAGAVTATVVVVVPVFLLGGLSVLIARDLRFSVAGLGILVSVYFAVCALCSVPTGYLVERYGAQRTTRAGIVLAAVSLLLIAVAARSYGSLLAILALAGAANALAQLGSNLSLTRSVPPHRMGLSFGVKQAAIPISTLLAGIAVPAIGLTLGWRWAFGLAAAMSLAALLVVPPERGHVRRSGPAQRSSRTRALVVVGVAGMLASGTANALGAFLVSAAVDKGIAEGTAGLVLAAGSALGVVGRVGAGWLADRRTGGHLLVVTAMLALGSGGLALLAAPGIVPMLIGTLAGFGLGWAWPGLLNFAVVRLEPSAPAAATSITQTGVYAGGAAGPLAFGTLVHATSYPTAWLSAAAIMVVSAGLMLLGRRMLLAPRPS
jgi:predicted MFS family arabinose efflux permease